MGVIIVGGIAVIALIAVFRGGANAGMPLGVSGSFQARVNPTGFNSNPNPLNPVNSSPYVGAGVNAGASLAVGAIAMGGVTAAGAATAGIGAAAAIIGSLLAAHAARLKGATNENNAALNVVPSYDSFVQSVVDQVNSGTLDKGTAAAGLAQYDQMLYKQLRSLVGAPGTAWSDQSGMQGRCDKTCTVGCCLYYSDLGPPLSLLRYLLGDNTGLWGPGDPRLNGNQVTVGRVFPSKYSSYSRAQYTVTIN